jgi:putative PIN family toxin of toxin-antitoxin system
VKVVLDSNVLLAALGTRGLCEALLEACLAEHEPYISNPILDELKKHLHRKFKMTPARVLEIVTFLRSEFTLVVPAQVPTDACRDPNDLMVLGTAISARADCIATGDKDLLVLGEYERIPILTPRRLYDLLSNSARP